MRQEKVSQFKAHIRIYTDTSVRYVRKLDIEPYMESDTKVNLDNVSSAVDCENRYPIFYISVEIQSHETFKVTKILAVIFCFIQSLHTLLV